MTRVAVDYSRGVGRLVAAAVSFGMLAGCGPSDSGWGHRTDVFACESPDGELTAIFYVRQSGGAAGSQSEYVSVRPRGDAQEVLIFEMGHGYNVRLTWSSPTHLTIGYPQDANMLAWRRRFRRPVADQSLEVELEPVDSKNGLFPSGKDECVGGRPNMPLQPTASSGG